MPANTSDDEKLIAAATATRTPSVRTSVALSFAAKGTTAVVTLVASMVLARLLTPAETGVYAVGLAVMMLLEILREFGVSSYLIQERELDRGKIRAAFTVTLMIAWSAGLLLAAASAPLASYYGEPKLEQVLLVLSIGFVLLPFGTPTMGLLRREMRFGALYRITVGASIATAATAVTLAWFDLGPVSLAWGAVAGSAATTILAGLSRPQDALLTPTWHGLGPVLRFGGQTAGASIIIQITQTATPLIIGRMLGLTNVGLFSRANNLIIQMRANILGSVAGVAQPALATCVRDRGDLRESYLRACSLLTGIAWPLHVFLIFMAFPVFRILFGSRWDAAIPLFRILVVADIIFVILPFAGPALLAMGRASLFLRGELVIQSCRLALILAGAFHSIEAVCVAEVIGGYGLYLIVYGLFVPPLLNISFWKIIKSHGQSALVTLSSLLGPVCAIAEFGLTPANPFLSLAIATFGSVVAWGLAVMVFRHPLYGEIGRAVNFAHGFADRHRMKC